MLLILQQTACIKSQPNPEHQRFNGYHTERGAATREQKIIVHIIRKKTHQTGTRKFVSWSMILDWSPSNAHQIRTTQNIPELN